ncbi:hypothetical protein FGO68_gene5321 [Halteria grandinella]|uniref:Uncharacterized protein n=1 Tax=Halteria grandinella TaxID=5974 RepID=A0A8J8NA99_HALGN|nr:hypothetical protein FGO68_gene5321 [Halteria grandinella]
MLVLKGTNKRRDSLPLIMDKAEKGDGVNYASVLLKKQQRKVAMDSQNKRKINPLHTPLNISIIEQTPCNEKQQILSNQGIKTELQREQSPVINLVTQPLASHKNLQSIIESKTPQRQTNIVEDISVQGIEQLKFFKRLDVQIERQKRLYEFYVKQKGNNFEIGGDSRNRNQPNYYQTLDPTPLAKEMYRAQSQNAIQANDANATALPKIQSQLNIRKDESIAYDSMAQASTAIMSKSDLKSQYKQVIDLYKKNPKSMQRKYSNTIMKTLQENQ